MTHRSQFRILKLFLILSLLAFILLSGPLACAKDQPSVAMLDMGLIVNSKMKALAVNTDPDHEGESLDIKAIHMADSLPDGFIPSEANTVSTFRSEYPIYIFFDNDNDVGILSFYTDAAMISMNPYSGFLFADFTVLTDISGIADWDVSNVIDMSYMFYRAKSLPDALALRNWNTSNVTDMSYLFSNGTSLKFIDVSHWDTSRVTSMKCMFQVGESWKANGQLIEINGLGDLNVSNVTDMTCMFYGASQMTYYDISRWDVSKVESMNHMFCDNRSLKSLDLSKWDVSSLKTIFCMFDDNVALQTLGDVSHWNTVNLIDAGGWLNECYSFVGDNTGTLDLSGWNTINLKVAGEMFLNTLKLRCIDLSGWTFDSITNEKWEGTGQGIFYETGNNAESYMGLGGMFHGAKALKTVYISPAGSDSFNAAVERGVNTLDMWKSTIADGFTVK